MPYKPQKYPSTSEELKVYNFLRELGKIELFEYVKVMNLSNQSRKNLIFKGHVSLYGVLNVKQFTIEQAAILSLCIYLIIDDYDPEDFAYNIYKCYIFETGYNHYYLTSNGIRSSNCITQTLGVIKSMVEFAAKSSYFDSVPNFKLPEFEFIENGDFDLPWKYVIAKDGYFQLFHPNHAHEDEFLPFLLANDGACESFNNVDMEHISHNCRIRVNCLNGKIIAAEPMLVDYRNVVDTITNNLIEPDLNYGDPIVRCLNSFRKTSEIQTEYKRIATKNSIYLNYLIKKHLFKYNIKDCYETINTYCSAHMTNEEAFVFFLGENKDRIVFVYENESPSRCSYLFCAKKSMMEEAVESVTSFFASSKCNKRETMTQFSNLFQNYGIIFDTRILHTNYFAWHYTIDKLTSKFVEESDKDNFTN